MLRPIILSLVTTIGLSGCLRETPEVYLPVGHPADPDARSGAPIRISKALETEFYDIKPELGKTNRKLKELPSNDHSGHQMNKN
ncbi:MAG: hypothetical protein DHS20C07_30260 [Methyloligella sp.]|nr:MAG: hypothetical protein DHS20C07_30260 [Methyloligella sp.]